MGSSQSRGRKSVFLRVIEAEDKAEALRGAIADPRSPRRFEVDPESFRAVPRAPFAYWASDRLRAIFRELPKFHGSSFAVWSTNPLNEDFRYARVWWESPSALLGQQWMPWAKGGAHSPIYYDIDTVISWSHIRQSYGSFIGTANRPLTRPASLQHFFRPGLTWPRRTNGLSFRVMPAGCIFADKGPAAFVDGDDPVELLALCAVVNSAPFRTLVELQLARTELAQSYEVGLIQQTPIPELCSRDRDRLAALARRAWSLKRALDSRNETSHAFLLPPGLNEKVTGLDPARAERELAEIQRAIDEEAYRLYSIGPDDRAGMEAIAKTGGAAETSTHDIEDEGDDSTDEEDGFTAAPADTLFSWLVGVAFGRFDPRLATGVVKAYRTTGGPPYTLLEGQRPVPPEPEPFDPLPARSPGMWPEDEIPVVVPPDIMAEDPGHNDDIRSRVARAAAATGWPDPVDLRSWLAKEFFPLHIRMYSKSRRKAPIYWQLATPSASYSVWLYYHRFTRDTMYRVLNDFVTPKLAHEERKLASLLEDAGPNPSASQRREIDAQQRFVDELRALREEVARVAPLWNPDLNDGVIINFAPLWRLVPQNRSWQKECKAVWDKLALGDYDWSHLAMHLWPERVVPKCAKDRSLAIAHRLEAVFWEEDAEGNWKPKKVAKEVVDRLVGERTSAAVKAALDDLLRAPAQAAVAGSRRGAGRRRPATNGRRLAAPPPRASASGEKSPVDDATIDAVKEAIAAANGGATKADVIEATGISDSDWNAAIAALLAQGVVIKTGTARGTRYQLAAERGTA